MDAVASTAAAWNGGPGGAEIEPEHYGRVNAVYGLLLAGAALALQRRADAGDPIARAELPVLGIAAFAVSKAVSNEKVGTWIRDPFVEESAEGRPPRHGGVRGAVGELLTCSRCLGAWSSLGLVGLRLAHPPSARVVTPVLAVAGLNDFLQAGFNVVTAKANELG